MGHTPEAPTRAPQVLGALLLLGASLAIAYRWAPGVDRRASTTVDVRQQAMAAPVTPRPRTTTPAHEDEVRRLVDSASFFDPYTRKHFEDYLEGVESESQADIRIELLASTPEEGLDAYAVRAMRARGIGARVNGRGMLFVYDFASQRLRVEVGEGLQGVFPDGFVGYLVREQAASFFAAGNPEFGLRTTLFMANLRLREATLQDPYDARAIRFIRDRRRLASGGGATVSAGGSVKAPPIIGHPSTAAARARFAPASTPAQTLLRYEEWLRDGENQLDVPLFADGTEAIVRRWPATQAFHDYILYGEYGHRFTVIERGDLAMLVYTDTPFISPHFFRRGPAGWQFDLGADVLDTYECVGGNLTWSMRESRDDFTRAFADLFIRYPRSGIVRIRGGDNRFLPARAP